MDIFDAARKGIDKEECSKLIKGSILSSKDKFGQSPLHIAAFEGNFDIVSLFIKKGAAVDDQDKNGWTSLHCAASNGHIRICELLLKEGASPVAASTDGTTPLHYLARMPWDATLSPKVFGVALKSPVNINVVNLQDETPLHQASLRGNEGCVIYLLENGADPNMRNKQGETSLHFAIHAARIGTMRILLENGADPSICGSKGTADDLAKAVAVPGVLEALEEARARANIRKDAKKPYMKGLINKFGGKIVKGWKKMWFVLDGLQFACYSSENDTSPIDVVSLKDISTLTWEDPTIPNIVIFLFNGSKWQLSFEDKGIAIKWLLALDGLKHKSFESSIVTDSKQEALRMLFKADYKGGFIKSSFEEEWSYSNDGTLECTEGWIGPAFLWNGYKLVPKTDSADQFGWGQFNGFLFEWFVGSQAVHRFWYEDGEREYQNADIALTWKWTRHFLALKHGRGEWIVEGSVPEPVVFFLSIIRYRRLALSDGVA